MNDQRYFYSGRSVGKSYRLQDEDFSTETQQNQNSSDRAHSSQNKLSVSFGTCHTVVSNMLRTISRQHTFEPESALRAYFVFYSPAII